MFLRKKRYFMKEDDFDKLLVGITMCPLVINKSQLNKGENNSLNRHKIVVIETVRREADIIKNHSEEGSR